MLVIDTDVPWVPSVSRPPKGAVQRHFDIGPLEQRMPLWYVAQTVRRPEELEDALQAALHPVRQEKRAAALDVWVPHL